MNLGETIKHTRKKAEEMATKSVELFPSCEGRKYLDCAEEYYQLADWLEELKELRKYKEKYRWHYLKGVWFDVILFKIKNSPTRLNMQYCEDLGFGFYQSSKNSRRKFITAGEANLTEVVAWREIEEFESEEE